MAGCKKLRQGLKCHHYVLKKDKYAKFINYIILIVYNGIMYITIKINGKWLVKWENSFSSERFSLVCLKKMYVWFCVSVCLSHLLPGGIEINSGTILQITDLESLSRNPLEA